MAHNTRVRADFAAWATGAVTQTEFNKFDEQLFKAINGDDGGVWAPASAIVIGGSGIEVSGDFLASGDAEIGVTSADALTVWSTSSFTGPATFGITTHGGLATFNGAVVTTGNTTLGNAAGDSLTVNATSTFIAPGTFEDDLTIGTTSADDLTVWSTSSFVGPTTLGITTHGGLATFNGAADFNGATTFDGATTFNSTASFTGDVTLGNSGVDALIVNATAGFIGDANFDGDVTLGLSTADQVSIVGTATLLAPMTMSGVGRIALRSTIAGDASTSFPVTASNIVKVLPTTVTAARTLTISDTGAVNGDWMWFSVGPQNHNVIVENPAGAPVTFLATKQGFVVWMRMSGNWEQIAYYTT